MKGKSTYLSRDQQELFEQFIFNRLSVEERTNFEETLAKNEIIRKQFQEFKVQIAAIEEASLREKMNHFHHSLPHSENLSTVKVAPRSQRFIINYGIAASLLLLISIGVFWLFNLPRQGQKLFDTYYSPDPGLPTVMSNSKDYEFYEAMVDYKYGDYDRAIEKWKEQLLTKPQNDTLHYFLASAHMAKGDKSQAIQAFSKVIAYDSSVFGEEANYYMGLLYLQDDNFLEAEKRFLASDLEQAKRVLEHLQKK